MGNVAVVVGASGGIGGALVDALLASGRFDEVHALSRRPCRERAHLRTHLADVTDEASLARAAAAIGATGEVRLAIVASGLLHAEGIAPEKAMRALDPAAMAAVFAVNAIGPALVAKHVVPLLPRRGRSVFAALSARVGSIGDNHLGGWYAYRASKAALNQLVRTLSIELARTRPEAIALALHPGTVATALSRPFRADAAAAGLFDPAEAAARLLAVIDAATPAESGAVLAHDGSRIPY